MNVYTIVTRNKENVPSLGYVVANSPLDRIIAVIAKEASDDEEVSSILILEGNWFLENVTKAISDSLVFSWRREEGVPYYYLKK